MGVLSRVGSADLRPPRTRHPGAYLDALKREGIVYRGVLYAGLMLTKAGPKVLEFNCRFGDPEANRCWRGSKATSSRSSWTPRRATWPTPVLNLPPRVLCRHVQRGYPGAYEKGKTIQGIDTAQQLGAGDEQVIVFHAGTKHEGGEALSTRGTRPE